MSSKKSNGKQYLGAHIENCNFTNAQPAQDQIMAAMAIADAAAENAKALQAAAAMLKGPDCLLRVGQ